VKGSKISAFSILLLDIILVNFSFVLAFLIRYDFAFPKTNVEPYLSLIPWISILTGFIFLMFDLYSDWRRKGIHDLVFSVFLSIVALSLITMACTFLNRGFAFPRSVIFIAATLQVIFITLSRSVIWYFDKRIFGSQRVLVIAQDSNEGAIIAEKLIQQKGWFTIEGFLSAEEISEVESRLGTIDVVIISPNILPKSKIVNICANYGKEILIVPELPELFLLRSEPQQIDDMLVLSARPSELNSRQLFFKRLLDIIAAIILLTLFSPIIILLFIAIPLLSKGPALYKQERLGKNKQQFQILKFRSMIHNAEKTSGPVLATDKDPRITGIGRFIRATRLDELPQLFNVLIGHMSLVGPRPERLFFVRQFEETIPHYRYRMSIKPGVTGLAQVMGKYSTSVEDKLRFDMMYLHSYSFMLDLKILFRTIKVVLQREQASGVRNDGKVKDNFAELRSEIVHL
jgi:exopolysaccharide biosynthesis polyprenyl glycosylphosphotransferase